MQISTSWQDERWHYADTACRHIAALLPMLPAEYGKHIYVHIRDGAERFLRAGLFIYPHFSFRRRGR